jgi:serine/threonine-protein kinase
MGEVYRASHQLLARPAAVKLIRPEVLGAVDAGRARVIVERFRREAEATASLRSPHSISLYDFGVAQDGTFFYVMELLDGLDLESLVDRFGPVDPARVVHLLVQACESLEEAHRHGLIHRDVKPSNIFTCRMGLTVDFVKVLDYGLVTHEADAPGADVRLTAPDHLAGTPSYMAPEAVFGTAPLDHRADIYALGCVGYWLLTGQMVFDAPTPVGILFQHAQDVPVPPSRRCELPIGPALEQVILDCLAKHPDQRPQSALDLARRLRATLPPEELWTAERAERWWRRHRPASAQPTPTACDLYLTKTQPMGWATPVLAPEPRLLAAEGSIT